MHRYKFKPYETKQTIIARTAGVADDDGYMVIQRSQQSPAPILSVAYFFGDFNFSFVAGWAIRIEETPSTSRRLYTLWRKTAPADHINIETNRYTRTVAKTLRFMTRGNQRSANILVKCVYLAHFNRLYFFLLFLPNCMSCSAVWF